MISNFISYICQLCGYISFRIVSGILYLFLVVSEMKNADFFKLKRRKEILLNVLSDLDEAEPQAVVALDFDVHGFCKNFEVKPFFEEY